MRILISAVSLLLLTGCSPVSLPRLSPSAPAAEPADMSLRQICVAWRRALDGYDAAGERRRLADALRARGEDPSHCERDEEGRRVPLSPSVAAPVATEERATPRRPATTRRKRTAPLGAQRLAKNPTLSCSSELVKGPPARYKTVCR